MLGSKTPRKPPEQEDAPTAQRCPSIPPVGASSCSGGFLGVLEPNMFYLLSQDSNREIRMSIAAKRKLPAFPPRSAGTCARFAPCSIGEKISRNPLSILKGGIGPVTAGVSVPRCLGPMTDCFQIS